MKIESEIDRLLTMVGFSAPEYKNRYPSRRCQEDKNSELNRSRVSVKAGYQYFRRLRFSAGCVESKRRSQFTVSRKNR